MPALLGNARALTARFGFEGLGENAEIGARGGAIPFPGLLILEMELNILSSIPCAAHAKRESKPKSKDEISRAPASRSHDLDRARRAGRHGGIVGSNDQLSVGLRGDLASDIRSQRCGAHASRSRRSHQSKVPPLQERHQNTRGFHPAVGFEKLLSGKPYLVRMPDGKEMHLDAWLTEALQAHRAAVP